MIVEKTFLNKLKDFGLNSYESKLWTALLSRGISTAGELSDIANVPRSRTYDVLESLEKKGFIIMKIGKPIKYIAVPPSEAIERVKKKVQIDAEVKTKIINELKDSEVLTELSMLHDQGIKLVDPSEISGSIKGRDNLYSHLEASIEKAENEVIIMTTAQGFVRKVESFRQTFEKLNKKGVKVKVACPFTKEVKKYLGGVGGVIEARHTDDVKARFVIIDNKELMFMLLDDEEIHPSYDVGVWVNTPFFVGAISSFFNGSWEQMKKAE